MDLRQFADRLRAGWLDLIARRRRWLVAALAGLAVASAVNAISPRPPATRSIWVAATDLPGGRPLQAGQVRAAVVPLPNVPHGALPADRPVVGLMLAAPVSAGEPLTDVRILGDRLVQAVAPGGVAYPVHVADATTLPGVVRPGDRVNVYAVAATAPGTPGSPGRLVAAAAPVLAVPGGPGAGVVVVAVPEDAARRLASAATAATLSVAVVPEVRDPGRR